MKGSKYSRWLSPLFSGFTYFLMGPAHWIFGVSSSRRRTAIETRVAPAASV